MISTPISPTDIICSLKKQVSETMVSYQKAAKNANDQSYPNFAKYYCDCAKSYNVVFKLLVSLAAQKGK